MDCHNDIKILQIKQHISYSLIQCKINKKCKIINHNKYLDNYNKIINYVQTKCDYLINSINVNNDTQKYKNINKEVFNILIPKKNNQNLTDNNDKLNVVNKNLTDNNDKLNVVNENFVPPKLNFLEGGSYSQKAQELNRSYLNEKYKSNTLNTPNTSGKNNVNNKIIFQDEKSYDDITIKNTLNTINEIFKVQFKYYLDSKLSINFNEIYNKIEYIEDSKDERPITSVTLEMMYQLYLKKSNTKFYLKFEECIDDNLFEEYNDFKKYPKVFLMDEIIYLFINIINKHAREENVMIALNIIFINIINKKYLVVGNKNNMEMYECLAKKNYPKFILYSLRNFYMYTKCDKYEKYEKHLYFSTIYNFVKEINIFDYNKNNSLLFLFNNELCSILLKKKHSGCMFNDCRFRLNFRNMKLKKN